MRAFSLKPDGAPKLRENDIERACLDLLLAHGWYPIRLQSGFFRTKDGRGVTVGAPGLPDYVVLHETHPGFFLETKRPKGQLSVKQEKKRWELELGYRLAVAVVDGVERLVEWLAEHEKKEAR